MGEAQLARLAMRKAHRMQPEDKSTARALADLCALTGDAEGAVEAWQSLKSLLPDDPEVLAGTRALKRLGKGQEALERLQRASVSAPDVALYRLELAEALMAEGRLTEALDTYAAAVEAFPADEVVRVKAGLRTQRPGRLARRSPAAGGSSAALAGVNNREISVGRSPPCCRSTAPGAAGQRRDHPQSGCRYRCGFTSGHCARTAERVGRSHPRVQPGGVAPGCVPGARVDLTAAHELGEWAHVLRPDTLPAGSPLPAVVEALHGLVRLADAAWLYGAASAHRHAPPPSCIDAEAWTAWTALEQSTGMQEQTPGSTPCLRLRADIHRRANDSETRERLAQSCSSDPTGADATPWPLPTCEPG